MEKRPFTVQGAAPHLFADRIRDEMLQSLMGPAPCWPDGTPRWKPAPKLEATMPDREETNDV